MLELMLLLLMSQQPLESTAHPLVGQTVVCSWYGEDFQGLKMANGQPFNMNDKTTVAHKSLPFDTRVTLRNPVNGKVLTTIVQDDGPHVPGREFDLSKAGAEYLDFIGPGVAPLQVISITLSNQKPRGD